MSPTDPETEKPNAAAAGEAGSTVAFLRTPRVTELAGLTVRRALPTRRRRTVGPWIFFDHMGPAEVPAGGGLDVPPHPHIGLATVTYLFAGEMLHRDSLGSVQAIRPGDLNLMVAGRGIVHSEREPPAVRDRPRRLHGLQLWLALPEADEVGGARLSPPSGRGVAVGFG